MGQGRAFSISDIVWRLAGATLLLSGWLIIRWVYRGATLPSQHELSLLEFAAVAVAFLCGSVGSALTTLGSHLFDPVEIAERWTPQHCPPSWQPPLSPPPAPAVSDTVISSMFGGDLFPPNLVTVAELHIPGRPGARAS